MKIEPIKTYSINKKYNFAQIKKDKKPVVSCPAPISFGSNPDVQITGISEQFFDSIFKNIVKESEINNIKDSFLKQNGKFNPNLGYLFLQTFTLGAEQRKKDSPGMSDKNKNEFAFDFASNVFFAMRGLNNKYDFSNFAQNAGIIYNVQKSGTIDDMLNFLFCSKDEKSEKFLPDVAKSMYKIICETNYQSPIDIKFYIDDYARDKDGKIDEDSLETLIDLMGIVGAEHVDAYKDVVYNSKTKEFNTPVVRAIGEMFEYFNSDECENKDYKGFPLDARIFVFAILRSCTDREEGYFDEDLFESYFRDIRLFAGDDFRKMFNNLLNPGEDDF